MKEYTLYLTDVDGIPYSTDALLRRLDQQNNQFLKLYLSWTNPDSLVIRRLLELMNSLPSYVCALNFCELFQNHKVTNLNTLKKIIASIPQGICQLEVDYLLPSKLSRNDVAQIFASFPKNLEHLSLFGNRLRHILYFIENFAQNYSKLNSLDIRALRIYEDWSTESFNLTMSQLPPQITTLYLNLDWIINERMDPAFPVLTFPQYVDTLGLMPKEFWQAESLLQVLNNSYIRTLHWLEDAIWPELIAQTPACIHSLSFDNYLPKSTLEPKDFIACTAHIPPHITTLSLKNNHLYLWPVDSLLQLFQAIPKTVKNLALEGNELFSQRTNNEHEQLREVINSFQVALENDTAPYQSEDSVMSDPMMESTEENDDESNHYPPSVQYKTQDFISDEDYLSYQSSPECIFSFFEPKKSHTVADNLRDSPERDSFDLFASLDNSSVNRKY